MELVEPVELVQLVKLVELLEPVELVEGLLTAVGTVLSPALERQP